MNCLFFVNTPAHVHLYKHAVERLEERGHDVLVLARDYTCTLDLVEWFELPHEVYGYCDTSKWSLACRLPAHYVRAVGRARRFDPDVVVGMGSYAAHTAAAVRSPLVLFIDSEPSSMDHALSTPFASAVLTPETFRKDLGANHYVFPGFKECAYLHPDVYEPNPGIRDRLPVESDEPYVVLRLNAFGSSHDVGQRGITGDRRRRLVERLAEDATVLVSDEGGETDVDGLPAEPFDLHPALIHDVLAEAELLVADTQTMVTEAALLGTPAIRSNSFVGESDMGNFVALEKQGLIYNVADFEEVVERAATLLRAEGIDREWRRRRDEYLADKRSLTRVIVDAALSRGDVSEIDSLRPFGEPSAVGSPRPAPVESAGATASIAPEEERRLGERPPGDGR